MRDEGPYCVETLESGDRACEGMFGTLAEADGYAEAMWRDASPEERQRMRIRVVPAEGEAAPLDPDLFDSLEASVTGDICRPFAVLVLAHGLSPMEALSYILCRVDGMDPSEACRRCRGILGREVASRTMSNYVMRARAKLRCEGASLLDLRSHALHEGPSDRIGAPRRRWPAYPAKRKAE